MTHNSKIGSKGHIICPRFFGNGKRLFGIAAAGLALVALVAASSARAQVPSVPSVGGLDCNGLSPVQQLAIEAPRGICADVRPQPGQLRAEDNGTYIGHDEPMVTFYSGVPGSGDNVQWEFVLPTENPLPATQSFEKFIAFWFGMALCDPNSFPSYLACRTATSTVRILRAPRSWNCNSIRQAAASFQRSFPAISPGGARPSTSASRSITSVSSRGTSP